MDYPREPGIYADDPYDPSPFVIDDDIDYYDDSYDEEAYFSTDFSPASRSN